MNRAGAPSPTASAATADVRLLRRKGPGRPTRNQAVERDRELLDVALDLFYQRGFEGTTIDAITATCNMAKRTVYARYEDKESLFRAALQHGIEQWVIPITKLQAAEDDDLEASLLRMARILVDNVVDPTGQRLMRIINAEAARMPDIGVSTLQQGTQRMLVYLADMFHRRVRPDDPAAPYAMDAAQAFIHIAVGGIATMRAWGMAVKTAKIERQTQFGVRLFLHGLLDD